MPTPITRINPIDIQQPAPPAAPKPAPHPQVQKSGAVSSDQVTLHHAGDVDHDGDSK
jgi:hypothetical protein